MAESGEALPAGAAGRPGVIIKLFGAILMMLGLLDSLLTLRGGLPAHEFLLLIFVGAAVFAAGAIRSAAVRRERAAERAPEACGSHHASP